jgi:predicted DNA-binding transcriptional regulator YafY
MAVLVVVSMGPTVGNHQERFVPDSRYDREMLDTSARLLRLLSLLQSRPWWSGPELAERLEVSTRTIRNDVDRLRTLGYPVDATRGSAGGYRLGVGAVTPPLLLDDDEAVAVAVALSTAAGSSVTGIEESAVRALAKVEQLLPSRLRRRMRALQAATVAPPTSGPTVDATVLTTIAAACRDHEGLRLEYRRQDGTTGRRSVEPHRLVPLARRWYLVAWDLDRDDWRTFRVDRIDLPRNHLGDRFTPRALPADVAASVTRGVESAPWAYRAQVRVAAPADRIRARVPSAVEVDAIDDASCLVAVGADDPHVLALYLGMLDADFTVADPDAHPALLEQLAAIAERYRRAASAGQVRARS